LILAHSEKIVLLRDLIYRTKTIWALPLGEVLFSPESFTGNTIPTLIIVLIDLPMIVEILKDLLDHLLMANFRRTDEIVIGDGKPLPEGLEALNHFIAVSFWVHPSLLGGLLNLLAMLVSAGKEKNLKALQTLVTGEDVSGNGGVGVADVGDIIDIVDGSGDVKGPFRFQMHGW
jgi:hypothetical protein